MPAGRPRKACPSATAAERWNSVRPTWRLVARDTPEKWAATTAVLFTALGFVAIIQGRKQIDALASGYRVWDAVSFLVGFAVAVLSIVLAAWAA
jgi:hypothetical protein